MSGRHTFVRFQVLEELVLTRAGYLLTQSLAWKHYISDWLEARFRGAYFMESERGRLLVEEHADGPFSMLELDVGGKS